MLALAVALLGAPACLMAQSPADSGLTPLQAVYRPAADSLIAGALADSSAYTLLAQMTDRFGHRLSGSAALEQAIDWILSEMRQDGLDSVRGEPVVVPHWVRGEESLELLEPRLARLPILGLGGSIATPPDGITAPVLVVTSFDDLHMQAPQAQGKIVVFDVPFTTYGATVAYRVTGAIQAARAGAVASLVRSVTPFSLRTPHTGVMYYDSTVVPIPHAAITVEDAKLLHRMQDRGERIVIRLRMADQMLPDAPSRNVIAELRGRVLPEEVVVMGGHIDSWDVGQGAVDDGGGVAVAWQALRLMKRLGLRPKRTVRIVGWTNEENGLRGAMAYRNAQADALGQHVLAIESDGGAFRPRGFGFTGSDSAFAIVGQIAGLLRPIGADSMERGGGEADIGPLMKEGVPGMGLNVDGTRYFWYHHTNADTIDKLDPQEMSACVAAMAVMAYVVADLPEQLPR
jgi:carboxypeptidase Q